MMMAEATAKEFSTGGLYIFMYVVERGDIHSFNRGLPYFPPNPLNDAKPPALSPKAPREVVMQTS
jgi:hypothetical protein